MNKKKSNIESIGKNKITVIALIVVIAMLLSLIPLHFILGGQVNINALSRDVFKAEVTLENAPKKIADITVSPYSFPYFKVYKNSASPSNKASEEDNSALLGYGIYIQSLPRKSLSFSEAIFGLPEIVKLVVFFGRDGNYKGTYLVSPKRSFDVNLNGMINAANSNDLKYLMLHVGIFYKTSDKRILDLERKVSNACILMYSHIKGKQELYKILPPPGKNANVQFKNFIEDLKVRDCKGNTVDFSKLSHEKVIIVTVNPMCASCLDNFTNFVMLIPRNMAFDRFVVVSNAESKTVSDMCDRFLKNFHKRCNLVIDKKGEVLGNGKLSLGELVMFDNGYRLYFKGPIGELLEDSKVLNKIFNWGPYGNQKFLPPVSGGKGGGNVNP